MGVKMDVWSSLIIATGNEFKYRVGIFTAINETQETK